jgi:hypothetical protein
MRAGTVFGFSVFGAQVLVIACAGCVAPSLEEEAADELGPEPGNVEPGPEHRPNQPCLRCHSEDADDRGDEEFAVAGTAYRFRADTIGTRGLVVEITDADGVVYSAQTNDAGNFFLVVEDDVDAPEQRQDGELRVPSAPRYPLRVVVRDGGFFKEMEGPIWREGSCAECHTEPAGPTSNGRVYARDP